MAEPAAPVAGTPSPRGRLTALLWPVRVRIALAATLVTAAAMVVSGWLLIRSIEGTQVAQLRRSADAELDRIAEAFAAGAPLDFDGFTSGITFLELTDGDRQVVVDATGGVGVVSAGNGSVGSGVEVADDVGVRVDAGGLHMVPGDVGGDVVVAEEQITGRAVSESESAGPFETVVRTFDGPSGEVTMVGTVPVDEVSRSVAAVRRSLLWGLPAVVALVGLSTWWWVGRALRPVEMIRARAASIGGSTIHRRVPEPPGHDEVGRLARTMNAMLDRLDRSARRQRQFVSDASHELRSPVAAIRTDLEVALHEGDAADWPAVARDVLAEEARLERLLADLLVLAVDDELEDGRSGEAVPSTDLGPVVAAQAARSRRVPIVVTAPTDGEPVRVRGSDTHLARLVGNLLDNAARHATERVEVTVTRDPASGPPPGTVRLVVDDDGAGIAPEDRERVFERFVRLDEGRARDDGGAGLGLAVVRAIAGRSGGRVSAEDGPGHGARFVVELPAAL